VVGKLTVAGRSPEDPGGDPGGDPGSGPGGEADDSDPATAETPLPEPGELSPPGSAPGGRGKGPRQVRAGDTLGRYELGDELGEGGMATVFRARDRELRRDVAVKVMFPHLARRAEIVRRFHREARAAAGLEHANILRIYDVGGGEGDDPPYIVMELIRGRTLLQEIEVRGAMLAEVAACIGALLGDALAAAHAAGVIHRDIKPANVLIAPGGRLLLADFGVARLETEDSLVTRTGALLGTPAYMSPEQACGDIATAQSDVYSLGATLYQLATGALPYGGSPAKVMSQIATGNLVAPMRRRPSCGPDLSRLIERVMAVEPSARPASATAIAAELRAFAAAGGFGDATEELAAYFEDPDGFLRTRTPTVVSALISAARAAVTEAKLPRAMALADRASALAPEDPAVGALVESVTQGGHASRRKRRFALGGAATALAGGVTALALGFAGSSDTAPPRDAVNRVDAALAFEPPRAREAARDAELALDAPAVATLPVVDAGSAPVGDARAAMVREDQPQPIERGEQAPRLPGGRESRRDEPRAPRSRDAALPPTPDASLIASILHDPPIDARPPAEPLALDAAIEPAAGAGHVIVRNDLWCNVWIDGVDHGNRRNQPIEVTAGHHVVRCVNPVGEWTQEADVSPGTTRTLAGTLLRELEVTLEVDATIDGKPYARGTVVKLKPRNVEVVVDGKKKFITFRVSCTLKDNPELGCYL
jgi:serine/threonine-protein kinase